MLQQPALAVDAATEAGKLAVRTDDAVTRNDDGDGVLAVGGTDGAGGSQVAQAARDVAVAARHPVGNRAQLLPHPQLERSAARVERQIEAGASAGEVLGELVAGASEYLSPCPSPLRGSGDRKSTRLNSSHLVISYAVFCLKKKKQSQPVRVDLSSAWSR